MRTTIKDVSGNPDKSHTVAPLADAAARASTSPGPDAEFVRVHDCGRLWGLKRGTIYNLAKEGKIVLRHYRKRGALRGITLVDVASVRRFLAELPTHDNKARP